MTQPRRVQQSRTIPIEVERAFDQVLVEPLPGIFSRRYGPLPPIREVRDQDGTWGTVGQTRTIVTTDGGTMRERLTVVDRPRRFGYEITGITGPMKPLIASVDGDWAFEPAGTGVRITWTWDLHPASGAAGLALPVFARLWRPYAARALQRIEDLLLDS